MKRKSIVWFRQDLRLHDNEALTEAIASSDEILPVYIFDERIFNSKTAFGFKKIDKYRAKFVIESVQNLRDNLKKIGAELIVRVGKPEDIITEFANQLKTSYVFCNRERTQEELNVQDVLEQNLWTIGQEIRYFRGKMLYYTADLPFPITQTPENFTQYRKEVEKITLLRKPLPAPSSIKMLFCDLQSDKIPTLEDLGFEKFDVDKRSVLDFKGGETAGLERLQYYLWETDLLKTYEDTRNGLLGGDYSSKFSPWLAQGCLSPKLIYDEIKKYELERGANKSTYWMYFELLWRDYFRLIGKKHGNKIFQETGITGNIKKKNDSDLSKLQNWIDGKTENNFINANMLELKHTGFMSNRGRQNVASYFINDMGMNWLMGASYFESMLIDYDPCSNYCNWCYLAGVGNDPRDDRYFNTNSQMQKYDPQGIYTNTWAKKEKVI
jgi:deoxyribodipyrimidine photo-lyase